MEARFLKKAIVLTGFGCNSNCVFCLQTTREPAFFPRKRIIDEIASRRSEGANWLILTGGEASIHPNFLDFVAFGKRLGYERIQVITNGRMFSKKSFVKKAQMFGLNEITLSFHGPNAKKHDALTMVPGSFDEACRAVENCKELGMKMSFNTALSSLNALDLGDIARLIHEDFELEGVDYDIVGTAPTGRTWKRGFMPEHEDVREGIRRACEYGEKHNLVVWLTRTPIQDMPEGYECHKEPWEVITHDTLAMWDRIWSPDMECEEGKCEYCEAGPLCFYVKELKRRFDKGKLSFVRGKPEPRLMKLTDLFWTTGPNQSTQNTFSRIYFNGIDSSWDEISRKLESFTDSGQEPELIFEVNRESLKHLEEAREFDPYLSPTNPYPFVKYDFSQSNVMHDQTDALMDLEATLESADGRWMNVPLCINEGRKREYWLDSDEIAEEGVKARVLLERLVGDVRVFPWDCERCALREACPGFFGDYVKLFGFEEVSPFDK